MDMKDLKQNLYVQEGRTLFKVSTVYTSHVTVQVLFDKGVIPGRTSVRSISADDVKDLKPASAQIIRKYEEASGVAR